MTRKQAAWALAACSALFALRMSLNVGVELRGWDESHVAAATARTIVDGGPLYGNALVTKGPVLYWFTGAVFRVCGVYSMVAWRLAAIGWWVATAVVVAAAARQMLGRAASVAAGAAFLLAAANPGFQEIRCEALVCLPLAAAVALSVGSGGGWRVVARLLAGAACAMAFLTKPNAGLILPVCAAYPLLCWWWRRRDRRLWLSLLDSACIVAGFAATVGATMGYYAARGAAHEFFYCVWTFNWAFLRERTPAGGFLPSLPYFWARVCRYARTEPLLPMSLVGAALAFVRRDEASETAGGPPARANAVFLGLLLAVMWLAGSAAGIPALSRHAYVHYITPLYVPMCLLVGVCVECLVSGKLGRRPLLWVGGGLVAAYVVLPVLRPEQSVVFLVRLYAQSVGLWHLAGAAALLGVAAFLLGRLRVAGVAVAVWAVLYAAWPELLGWEGAHLSAAGAMVSMAVLWHAVERRWMLLALAAGFLHAGAFVLAVSPQLGLVAGAVGWVLLRRDVPRGDRLTLGLAYAGPPLVLGLAMAVMWRHAPWAFFPGWPRGAVVWALNWRLAGTLVLCGASLVVVTAQRGAALQAFLRSPLALLVVCAVSALVFGLVPALGRYYLAAAGTAWALAAACALWLLVRRDDLAPQYRARMLLAGGLLAGCMAAVAVGSQPAPRYAPSADRRPLIEGIEPGSRLYIFGEASDTELYVRGRAIPAVPQVYYWMVEGVAPPPLGTGWYDYPPAATLAGLDAALCDAMPDTVALGGGQAKILVELPRFGKVLTARYAVAAEAGKRRIYRRIDGKGEPPTP